jgi:hypothetical protein
MSTSKARRPGNGDRLSGRPARGVDLTQHSAYPFPRLRLRTMMSDMLETIQKRMADSALGCQWQNFAAESLCGDDLTKTPLRRHIITGDEANNGISPPQTLIQELLPRIPALDAVLVVVVEENVMAVRFQPVPYVWTGRCGGVRGSGVGRPRDGHRWWPVPCVPGRYGLRAGAARSGWPLAVRS